MKTIALKAGIAGAALVAMSGIASAEVMAKATTDLNIRSGPGPQYDVVGVIGASEDTNVGGCIDGSKWCRVSHDGVEGWAYSDYLTASFDTGETVVMTERPATAVPSVTYEATASTGTGATAGATTGAVAGAIIGGPVGAAVGGAAGAVAGGAIDTISTPPAEVRTYVQSNAVEPVYLEGEVVVGAGLPETVEIREIPDYEYRYVYVNGQPVLVEPESRRIVYVMR